ncbi:eCIS core domain-containing protein [Sorangium sp. So ce1078]|uniref:eCIS core domain-containing protein n=1 Tax=Sorangium sp. So ce1078 TaxID=3133329 RepID=UPI003F63F127
MRIAVDRSTPKPSRSAARTSRARPPAPLLAQRRTMTPARPPAEPAPAALERAFGAELFAGAAAGPSVRGGSGPDRAVNLTGIPSPVKAKMEAAFGTDFSGVRVHPSSSRAAALGALAYTQGSEIHVAPGQWAPETTRGQELLGHELAHVVQQRAGRVRATAQYKGVELNDAPALEAEADAMGARAAHTSAGLPRAMARAPETSSEPLRGSSAVVQRMKRDQIDPGDVATVRPSMANYKSHVALRVTHFFTVFMKAVLLWKKHASQRAIPNLFTNNAAAQAGIGFRIKNAATASPGEGKYDAAHLTNVTLVKSAFSGMLSTQKDQENLDDLYRATAATTPQFQMANVTSDKIIDRQMTIFKNDMIKDLNAGAAPDHHFIHANLAKFLTDLESDLQVKSQQHPTVGATAAEQLKADSYAAALEIVTQLKTGDFDECFYAIVNEVAAYDRYNLA